MCKFRWVYLPVCLFVCLCCTGLWAQGAPYVVVSTTDGNLYRIDTPNGLGAAGAPVPLLATKPGAAYTMVVGPDNTSPTANPLLYVCDATNNTIVRLDPMNPPTQGGSLVNVYSSPGPIHAPVCGRVTAAGPATVPGTQTPGQNGDLVISSSTGLWVFPGITYNAIATVGNLQTTAQSGIAQKNTGDLLAVDRAHNAIFRTPAPAPNFSISPPLNQVVNTQLSSPLGIARRSDGAIFVSNQGGTPNVSYFTVNGNSAGSTVACEVFKGSNKGVPAHMQMSLDDTLFLAIANGTKGIVQSLNASSCDPKSIQSYSLSAPALGIALPPTSVAAALPPTNLPKQGTLGNGTALFPFGFAALEFNQIANTASCSGTVVVNLFSPAAISSLINQQGVVLADPAINFGLDGFEAVFSTADTALDGCGALDGTKNIQVSHFVPSSITNPQIFACDDNNPPTGCSARPTGGYESVTQIGAFPLGGYLPKDLTGGGSKSLRSTIFLANAIQSSDPTQQAGTFCGFQSPVNVTYSPNTATGSTWPWDVSLASSFSAGKSIPVKFKLGTGVSSSACQSSPYITNATALLSVAQVQDAKGLNVFVPIGLISNGSSGLLQPQFKGDNNQQYLFNWDSSSCIMPSGVTQVCPKGTYTLTVVLQTNNTVNQTIYDYQTTVVVLK